MTLDRLAPPELAGMAEGGLAAETDLDVIGQGTQLHRPAGRPGQGRAAVARETDQAGPGGRGLA